jgi:hypothetical protein
VRRPDEAGACRAVDHTLGARLERKRADRGPARWRAALRWTPDGADIDTRPALPLRHSVGVGRGDQAYPALLLVPLFLVCVRQSAVLCAGCRRWRSSCPTPACPVYGCPRRSARSAMRRRRGGRRGTAQPGLVVELVDLAQRCAGTPAIFRGAPARAVRGRAEVAGGLDCGRTAGNRGVRRLASRRPRSRG